MATFKAIQDEVLAYGFDPTAYRARVQSWINEAQSRIARSLELADLLTSSTQATANGTATYTFPTDLIRLDDIVDAALPGQLQVQDISWVLQANAAGTITGRPTDYAQATSTTYTLSPVPDAVYTMTLTYYKRPTDLSADADVSILPVDYHDLMVSYALQRAYRAEDDAQMAQFYRGEFERDLRQLGTDRQYVIDDAPRQIPGTWGSW